VAAAPLANLAVRIDRDVHLRAKLHAVKHRTSLAKLVEDALRVYLKRAKE
jgi:predicted HicB family RNase H-like nuclease